MSKELNVLSIKKLVMFVFVASFATAISADDSQQPVQLAQVTDGFDVEATYMMSCFACHSTGAVACEARHHISRLNIEAVCHLR